MPGNMVRYYAALLFSLFVCNEGFLERTLDNSTDAMFQTFSQELKQLKQTVTELQSQLNTQNATKTGPVAFTAGLSKTITMGSHQQIVFSDVLTNVGKGYSSLTGHFTAPVRGAYVFFVVLTNIPGHSGSIDLKKNGQWIGHALANGNEKDGGHFQTSTIAITVQLEQGDHVWVQNEWAYTTVEMLNGADWSTFSGHLISAN